LEKETAIKICFKSGELLVTADLDDSPTGRALVNLLPLEGVVSLWGEEIFFMTRIEHSAGAALTTDVNVGDVCFDPFSRALCVFFGRTPASVVDKPMPEHQVEIIGRNALPLESLKKIKQGDCVTVSLYSETPAKPAVAASAAPSPFGERKLSQGEIDELVKKLLAERKKAAG
jgi:hypothetical protein